MNKFINPLVNQIVAIAEMMVKITATAPIFFDLPSGYLKYFQAYQSPNGGKNKLTEYTVICFDNETAGSLSLSGLPQLGQKDEVSETVEWHEGQVVFDKTSISVFIIPKNRPSDDFFYQLRLWDDVRTFFELPR